MTPSLQTDRLLLLPLRLSDAAQAQELFAHWEVARYLVASVPWPYPEDGAHRFYRDIALPAVDRGDEWHWTLRLRSNPEQMIGAIALSRGEDDNRGFWLGLPWRGAGLMTEAVEAVTDFWFGELGFHVLRAPKAACNEASKRISIKTGMRFSHAGVKEYVSGLLPSESWEITRDEWLLHVAQRHTADKIERRA